MVCAVSCRCFVSELYSAELLARAKDVSRAGTATRPSGSAVVKNRLCGDQVTVTVRSEGDRIVEVRQVTRGCAVTQASAALMAELVEGATRAQAEEHLQGFHALPIFEPLAAAPSRKRCASLPWEALREALGLSASPTGTL